MRSSRTKGTGRERLRRSSGPSHSSKAEGGERIQRDGEGRGSRNGASWPRALSVVDGRGTMARRTVISRGPEQRHSLLEIKNYTHASLATIQRYKASGCKRVEELQRRACFRRATHGRCCPAVCTRATPSHRPPFMSSSTTPSNTPISLDSLIKTLSQSGLHPLKAIQAAKVLFVPSSLDEPTLPSTSVASFPRLTGTPSRAAASLPTQQRPA